ncbi:hypothetical protein HDU67_003403 [Dinochytrium kinnereticum]|nr:hypothetical protein HDU67_003403 [Dinochytrium kinnereticum]
MKVVAEEFIMATSSSLSQVQAARLQGGIAELEQPGPPSTAVDHLIPRVLLLALSQGTKKKPLLLCNNTVKQKPRMSLIRATLEWCLRGSGLGVQVYTVKDKEEGEGANGSVDCVEVQDGDEKGQLVDDEYEETNKSGSDAMEHVPVEYNEWRDWREDELDVVQMVERRGLRDSRDEGENVQPVDGCIAEIYQLRVGELATLALDRADDDDVQEVSYQIASGDEEGEDRAGDEQEERAEEGRPSQDEDDPLSYNRPSILYRPNMRIHYCGQRLVLTEEERGMLRDYERFDNGMCYWKRVAERVIEERRTRRSELDNSGMGR